MSRVCCVGGLSTTRHALCWHERNCSMRHSLALSVLGLGFVPNCFKTAAGSPKRHPKPPPKWARNGASCLGVLGGSREGSRGHLLRPFWAHFSMTFAGTWGNYVSIFEKLGESCSSSWWGLANQRSHRPKDQPTNRPTNLLTHTPWVHGPTDRPAEQLIDRPIDRPTDQAIIALAVRKWIRNRILEKPHHQGNMQKQADSFNSQYDQAARIVTQKWDLERKTDSTRKQVSKQVSKQTSKQASKQAKKQASRQTRGQARKPWTLNAQSRRIRRYVDSMHPRMPHTGFALSVLLAHQVHPLWSISFLLGSLFVLARPAREGGPGGGSRRGGSGSVSWRFGGYLGVFWSVDFDFIFGFLVPSI